MTKTYSQDEIQIDHEVIAEITAALDTVANELDRAADSAVDEVEEMVDEITKYFGSVPPIYQDIADALRSTAKKMKRVNDEVTTMLRADASTLENQSNQQSDITDTAVQNITNTDTTFV